MSLSKSDGLYIALAEQLGIPLVTLDARITAAPHIKADIAVLARRDRGERTLPGGAKDFEATCNHDVIPDDT